jgi:hypothetical protein
MEEAMRSSTWQKRILGSCSDRTPGVTEGQKQIRVDSQKFALLTSEGFLGYIAEGLPMAGRKLGYALEGLSYGPMFDEKLTVTARETKRSWVIAAADDHMLPPSMKKESVKRLGASATTVATCHIAMMQEPAKVAGVIDQAAISALSLKEASGAPEHQ